jgi:excisionase family DNA binding protein
MARKQLPATSPRAPTRRPTARSRAVEPEATRSASAPPTSALIAATDFDNSHASTRGTKRAKPSAANAPASAAIEQVVANSTTMRASPSSIQLDASPTSLRTLLDIASQPFSLLTDTGVQVTLAPSTQAAVRDAVTSQLAGPTDDELSSEAAAKVLGVSRSTVTRLLDAGTISCRTTAGGHRRVSRAELAGYLRVEIDRRQLRLGAIDNALARALNEAPQRASEQTPDLGDESISVGNILFNQHRLARGPNFFVPDRLWRLSIRQALATVQLPKWLEWSPPLREYALADRAQRRRCYQIVLREGSPEDLMQYIDGALLVDLWDELVLPAPIRDHWQVVVAGVFA